MNTLLGRGKGRTHRALQVREPVEVPVRASALGSAEHVPVVFQLEPREAWHTARVNRGPPRYARVVQLSERGSHGGRETLRARRDKPDKFPAMSRRCRRSSKQRKRCGRDARRRQWYDKKGVCGLTTPHSPTAPASPVRWQGWWSVGAGWGNPVLGVSCQFPAALPHISLST